MQLQALRLNRDIHAQATEGDDVSDNGDTPKHATLAEALVAAQKEMPAVPLDGVNPHFRSKHMTLGTLLSKARPVLNRHGIAVTQLPSRAEDGSSTLTTTLLHESGDTLSSVAPLLLTKNDPQGQGSAITYMRRYALASALGISDQEDDDGNAGSQGNAKNGDAALLPAEKAQAVADAARTAGMKARSLDVWLTSLGVVHDPITDGPSAVAAVRHMTPEQASDALVFFGGAKPDAEAKEKAA